MGSRGLQNCVGDKFDGISIPEIGRRFRTILKSPEEIIAFDDLCFRISDSQRGDGPEAVSVGMVGSCVDCPESAAVRSVVREAYLKLVSSFIVEIDGAFCSVDLEGNLIISSPGVSCGLDAAESAVFAFNHENTLVVYVNRLFRRVFTNTGVSERI